MKHEFILVKSRRELRVANKVVRALAYVDKILLVIISDTIFVLNLQQNVTRQFHHLESFFVK